MKTTVFANRKYQILLSASVGVMVFIMLILGQTAHATHEFPIVRSDTFPTPHASTQPLYMTVGIGAFESDLTGVAVLLPGPGTYTVEIEDAKFCNVDSYYTYEAPDLPNDDGGHTSLAFATNFNIFGPGGSGNNFYPPNFTDSRGGTIAPYTLDCTNRNMSFNFNVQASDQRASLGGKYIVYFVGAIGGSNPSYTGSDHENSFRIRIAGAEISPVSDFMNLSNRDREPVESESSQIILDFATSCSASALNASPQFFDLDTGTTVQPNQITVRMTRHDRNTKALVDEMLPATPMTGSNNVWVNLPNSPYSFAPNYLYRIVITGIYQKNALTYRMGVNPNSLSEIFAGDICPDPGASYDCTVTVDPAGPFAAGDLFTVKVNITITSSPPGSPQMTQNTHPITLSASSAAVQGLAVPTPIYTANPPNNRTVEYPNISINATGTYTITATVGTGVSCPSPTIEVGSKPYMKIFGGETMAGGGFGTPCSVASGGGVYAWARPDASGYAGASTQLTLSSLLTVNEFYSASNRDAGNTFPPKGLTFANSNVSEPWGGEYAEPRCITDYYNETTDASLDKGNWNGNNSAGFVAGRGQYRVNGSSLINSGPLTIPTGVQAAVYVDPPGGSLTINNNIIYGAAGAGWSTAPNFVLIVKGDLRIASNVTRLDGLYVAQGGIIRTCTPNSGNYSAANIFDNCQNQLSVNGGLIATDIRWLRQRGSTGSAAFKEVPLFSDGTGTAAAEVINYTPSMWLAPSPLKIPGYPDGNTPAMTGPYQSIKELPPIF